MYRFEAIILYKQIIRDNHVRVVFFSEDFGKITAWAKTPLLDIGWRGEVLVERKGGYNILKKIDIIQVMSTEDWKYEEVLEYMHILQILYETLPEGAEQRGLYKDVRTLIQEFYPHLGKVGFFLLIQSWILKKLGYLNEDFYRRFEQDGITPIDLNIKSMKSMFIENSFSPLFIDQVRSSVLEARHSYSYRL